MATSNFRALPESILALARETEWTELKANNDDPQEIGEYLSALANSAALHQQKHGYIVWGLDDETRRVVGTTFDPQSKKKGNQEIENWLATQLAPPLDFRILEGNYDRKRVVIIEVPAARIFPLRFRGQEYIRVGSYKKKLRDHPDKERRLWDLFRTQCFEDGIAAENVTPDRVLELIDYPAYFGQTKLPLPDRRDGILERLESEGMIVAHGGDRFDVTNLGAILFARDLGDFKSAVLFAPKPLGDMERLDRIRACYQHACLQYVSGKRLTNSTLGERLSIDEKNRAIASRIISDTVEVGLIRRLEPQSRSRRHAKYAPFWA